jgi:hypothetical protein
MEWNKIKINIYLIFDLQHETSKHETQHVTESDHVLCLQGNEIEVSLS